MKKIKQLQNNFTTPEQSKRLLELGVPADSADMYICLGFEKLIWHRNIKGELSEDFFDALLNGESVNTPIWSVGRLIEIAHICSGSTLSYKEEAGEIIKFKEVHKCNTLIEAVIMCIEDAHSLYKMDFSKLEV